jgi:hypothetical protein
MITTHNEPNEIDDRLMFPTVFMLMHHIPMGTLKHTYTHLKYAYK